MVMDNLLNTLSGNSIDVLRTTLSSPLKDHIGFIKMVILDALEPLG
jgi:hypothetical protein